jgi:hypothetical protein
MMHGSAHADTASSSSPTPRHQGRLAVLVGLAVLLTGLVTASAAQAKVPKDFFGSTEGGTTSSADYELMHDINVGSRRLSINWKITEPQRGTFNWSRTDTRVAALAHNDISPFFVLWGAPEWATGSSNGSVPPLKSSALQAWKTFVDKAVKRYKKGGEFWRTHPNVPVKPAHAWQIWNEPNLAKYFSNRKNSNRLVPHAPKAYGKFVKASDKAVHRADKRAKVILAGLSGAAKHKNMKALEFIKKVLKVRKVKKHFDAAALHPYAPKIKEFKSRVSKFRKALNRGGAKKKEIWLTEVGWGSKKNGKRLNKGLAGQARMLKKSFKMSLEKRKKWKLDHVYWYAWRDPAPDAPVGCSFCTSAGLLRFNGDKKPSFRRFKHFTKMQG